MHTVIETNAYLTDAKAAGMKDDEREAIVSTIAAEPMSGEVMQGTGGARKLRYAKPGTGKSGGYRLITFYAAADVPVFLLNVFAKGDKLNLTKAERNALAVVLNQIADEYRRSTARAAEA